MRIARPLVILLATVALSVPAAAREPDNTITLVVPGTDPCTGAAQTVTIVIDLFVQQANGATVVLQQRSITTVPSGYIGRGTATVVSGGPISVQSLRDTMVNEAGARVRVHGTIITDTSTVPPTLIVQNVDRECVQP